MVIEIDERETRDILRALSTLATGYRDARAQTVHYVLKLEFLEKAESIERLIERIAVLDGEVKLLLNQARKIFAIKLCRERTGLGLKEAKEYVDRIQDQIDPGWRERSRI